MCVLSAAAIRDQSESAFLVGNSKNGATSVGNTWTMKIVKSALAFSFSLSFWNIPKKSSNSMIGGTIGFGLLLPSALAIAA